MAEEGCPLSSVKANDSHDNEAEDDRVIDDTRRHYRNIVHKPERGIDSRAEAAYGRIFLHYRKGKEPSSNAGENIIRRCEVNDRYSGKAAREHQGEPYGEIFFLNGKDEADNSLNYAEEDNAACGCRTAEDRLSGEKSVSHDLGYDDNSHILELHTGNRKYGGKYGDYVIYVFAKKFEHFYVLSRVFNYSSERNYSTEKIICQGFFDFYRSLIDFPESIWYNVEKKQSKEDIPLFVKNEDIKLTELGGGVSRKILAYDESLMSVEVRFEKGAVGAMHTHPHVQISYVLEGKFEATINGETTVIAKGDTYITPPDAPHGVVCLEAGALLDIFTPMRSDFLK